MSISVICPNADCRHSFLIKNDFADESVRCPNCNTVITSGRVAKQGYRHTKCGSRFDADSEFLDYLLSDPYHHSRVFCSHCSCVFPEREFVWEANGETFRDCTKRLRREMPFALKFLRLILLPAGGLLLGGAFGAVVPQLTDFEPYQYIMLGAACGAGFGWYLGVPITQRLRKFGLITWRGSLKQ